MHVQFKTLKMMLTIFSLKIYFSNLNMGMGSYSILHILSHCRVSEAEKDTVSKRLCAVSKALDMKKNHIEGIRSVVGIFDDGVQKADSSCCAENNDDEEDQNIQLVLFPQVMVASVSEAQTL